MKELEFKLSRMLYAYGSALFALILIALWMAIPYVMVWSECPLWVALIIFLIITPVILGLTLWIAIDAIETWKKDTYEYYNPRVYDPNTKKFVRKPRESIKG